MKILIALTLFSSLAWADTPPPNTVKAKTFTGDGVTGITAHGTSLDVNVTNSSGTQTVNQGSAGSQSWLTSVTASVLPTNACVETGGHLASIDSKLANPMPVSGTFWQTTQPVSGSVSVSNFPATQAISAVALPLPTGAATSAKQPSFGTAGTPAADILSVQGAASMTPLKVDGSGVTQPVSGSFLTDTQLRASPVPVAVSGSITTTNAANGTTGTTTPTIATQVGGTDGAGDLRAIKVSTTGVVSVDGSAVTQPVSAASLPLPTGASTSAAQTTGNGSLSSIDGKTPALVSGRVPVDGSGVTQPVSGTLTALGAPNPTGSYAQITNLTTTAQTLTVPTHAVGFNLMAPSTNSQNVRWSSGSAATTTSGLILEPGRDTGYIPLGASISVIAVTGSSQSVEIQWVLNQ